MPINDRCLTNHHNTYPGKQTNTQTQTNHLLLLECVGQLGSFADLSWAWLVLSVFMHQMPASGPAGEWLGWQCHRMGSTVLQQASLSSWWRHVSKRLWNHAKPLAVWAQNRSTPQFPKQCITRLAQIFGGRNTDFTYGWEEL